MLDFQIDDLLVAHSRAFLIYITCQRCIDYFHLCVVHLFIFDWYWYLLFVSWNCNAFVLDLANGHLPDQKHALNLIIAAW